VINFRVSDLPDLNAVLVEFEIEGGITTPQEAFSVSLPEVPSAKGVVVSGRGPVWLYGRLVHHFHPARWVAVFDPRLNGAVVVASHWPEVKPGEVLKISA